MAAGSLHRSSSINPPKKKVVMEFLGSMLFGMLWLAGMLIGLASMWVIFTKAGRQGWEGIIPIYNLYVLLQIVGKPTWWLILFLIPGANIVFGIWTINMLSKSFGKDEGFTIGILLLSIVFLPILAFGDAKYQGPYGARGIQHI
jgi:hypothetical protein